MAAKPAVITRFVGQPSRFRCEAVHAGAALSCLARQLWRASAEARQHRNPTDRERDVQLARKMHGVNR